MLRVMDAAALLGISAVTGFVGRDQSKSMAQNLVEFERSFVPLLKAAKDRGISYRVEQCPMPGWTPGDNFHNNIAYTPAAWIALHQIAERNGVGDQFRIHYDPSHSILMGQDTRSMFQYLKDEGYAFLIAGMHVKGQVIDPRGVSAWGYGGRRCSAATGTASRSRATRPTSPTPGRSRPCCASTSCPAPRGTTRSPTCRTAPSTGWTTSWPPRAARRRRGHHAAHRGARISCSARAGQGPAAADPGRVHRLHPAHRPGSGSDVRVAARGPGRAGHSRPGRRPSAIP
jgi:hypothetical protein